MAKIDAIALIEEDHSQIRKMIVELEGEIDLDARSAMLDDITTLIQAHSEMEIQAFYPALLDAVGTAEAELLFHRCNLEHEVVDQLLQESRKEDPGSLKFLAIMEMIRQDLELHMKLEEEVLIPRAREELGADQLEQLGEQMDEIREQRIRQVAEEMEKVTGDVVAPGP
jgi:hemerythrin superfamily protein